MIIATSYYFFIISLVARYQILLSSLKFHQSMPLLSSCNNWRSLLHFIHSFQFKELESGGAVAFHNVVLMFQNMRQPGKCQGGNDFATIVNVSCNCFCFFFFFFRKKSNFFWKNLNMYKSALQVISITSKLCSWVMLCYTVWEYRTIACDCLCKISGLWITGRRPDL